MPVKTPRRHESRSGALAHFFLGADDNKLCADKQRKQTNSAPNKATMSRPTRKSAARAQEAIERDHARRKQLTEDQRKQEDLDEEDEHWEPGQPLHGDEPDDSESSPDDEESDESDEDMDTDEDDE